MDRVLIHVEGETEESFVNEVLAKHLYTCGFAKVSARLVGNARQRDRRGGIRAWNSARNDILHHLKEDPAYLATTMVDYYGLPQTGVRAWPGRAEAGSLPFPQKAARVQDGMMTDICADLGEGFDRARFIPYVMMHEFEGLLFSNCERFALAIGRSGLATDFETIRSSFATPEEINDSPVTAPSKRVEALVEGYQKPLYGTLAALEIGLEAIRAECPLFRNWLERLEIWPSRRSKPPIS